MKLVWVWPVRKRVRYMGPNINLTVEDSSEKMNWKNIKLVIT